MCFVYYRNYDNRMIVCCESKAKRNVLTVLHTLSFRVVFLSHNITLLLMYVLCRLKLRRDTFYGTTHLTNNSFPTVFP